jgi:hypothetical protein
MTLRNKVLQIFQVQKMVKIPKSFTKNRTKDGFGKLNFYHKIIFLGKIGEEN